MAERDSEIGVARGPNRVTIIWADESKEPAKFDCIGYSCEGGFVIFDIEWFKGHKTLVWPAHKIDCVEIMDEEAQAVPANYSESNTFREQPDKSKWFAGMGETKDG